ncbi:MAG: amino acid racemase [Bacteroidales bacterium]|nr:amino acid racemase [Bacteroidales bacterium]MCF8457299.1 amino acid racemase [Bacteroidales bacterium]
MKKIGLIGGLTPEATQEYYRLINKMVLEETGHFPEIILISLDLFATKKVTLEKPRETLIELFIDRIRKLEYAGAEIIAITANTPHTIFYDLKTLTQKNLISIVEETAKVAQNISSNKRIALLGTKFTMSNSFYQDCFAGFGLQVFVPSEKDQQIIDTIIFDELAIGIFKDESRRVLENIIIGMKKEFDVDTSILGCTELPLILKKKLPGINYLDTLQIHVNSIVRNSL